MNFRIFQSLQLILFSKQSFHSLFIIFITNLDKIQG